MGPAARYAPYPHATRAAASIYVYLQSDAAGPPPRLVAVNLFFEAFQPTHTWELTLLPATERHRAESADAFAARVARQLCEPLGLVATSLSTRDKATHLRLVKRIGKSAWLQQRAAASGAGAEEDYDSE